MSNGPDSTREPAAPETPPSAPVGDRVSTPSPAGAKPVDQLTPEEQMALFEKELKETDWGHQPC